MGTCGSRSLAVGGSALVKAMDKVIAKGCKIAARSLEASEEDIEFSGGDFMVAGTDKRMDIAGVAFSACVPPHHPLDELEPGLEETGFHDPANFTFPSGTHVCEVEVDPETRVTEIVKWVAVDDFGNTIRPMIVEGQAHPTRKQRLASPSDVVDPGGVAGLGSVRREDDAVVVGATNRHAEVAAFAEVRNATPALGALSDGIGDPQVRKQRRHHRRLDRERRPGRRLLGGGGRAGRRRDHRPADDRRGRLLHRAVRDRLCRGRDRRLRALPLPAPGRLHEIPQPGLALRHHRGRYVIIGVMVAETGSGVRVAETGAGGCVFRAGAMESALGASLTPRPSGGKVFRTSS